MRATILIILGMSSIFVNCCGDKYAEFREEIALKNHHYLISLDNSGSIDTTKILEKLNSKVITQIFSDTNLGPGSKVFVSSFAETTTDLPQSEAISFGEFDIESKTIKDKLEKRTTNSANFLRDSAIKWKEGRIISLKKQIFNNVNRVIKNPFTNKNNTEIIPFLEEVKKMSINLIKDENKFLTIYLLTDYKFNDKNKKWPKSIKFSKNIEFVLISLAGVKFPEKDLFEEKLKKIGASVLE